MSRRPARFTEADLKRAARVAKAMGVSVSILPDGSVLVTEGQKAVDESGWDMGIPREIVL